MKRTFFALVLCSCIGVLRADVVITEGNHPQQPGEVNILGDNDVFGNPILGHINEAPGVAVDFTSSAVLPSSITQTLVFHGGGQAEVTGCTNPGGPCGSADLTPINNLTVTAFSPTGAPLEYGDFIFNLNVNHDCINGPCKNSLATIEAFGLGGTLEATATKTLVEGENFFTIEATHGEAVLKTVITTTSTTMGDGFFSDLRQPRISNLDGIVLIPEPSTYAPLMALVLGAIAMVGKSRKKV